MTIPVRKPGNHYTYRDYASWPEGERWELIKGVAYAMFPQTESPHPIRQPRGMTPAPSRRHQAVSRELEIRMFEFLKDKPCEGYDAPFDVLLPEGDEVNEDISTVVQPDLVVVCDPAKLNDRGCLGAPDLVVEITSPATGTRDKKEKLELYERHGVQEYWLVDMSDATVMVFHQEAGAGYGRPTVLARGDRLHSRVLSGLEIHLEEVFKVLDS